jgi:hypothetical protein
MLSQESGISRTIAFSDFEGSPGLPLAYQLAKALQLRQKEQLISALTAHQHPPHKASEDHKGEYQKFFHTRYPF